MRESIQTELLARRAGGIHSAEEENRQEEQPGGDGRIENEALVHLHFNTPPT